MPARALPLLAVLLATAVLACVPRVDPRLVAQPISGRRWVSGLLADHPLVGRIWDAGAARFTDEAALSAAVSAADVVFLGETHDNPDHHLLQARLARAVFAAGRRPALAFEMLGTDQQPAVDGALAREPRDADALAKAVAWKRSGWPEFPMYRPIFQAGLDAGAAVLAANLPRKTAKEVVSKGAEALDAPLRKRLARDEPLPPALLESLRAEMRESHCGELPESLVDPLVLAQRARDAQMAATIEGPGERRAILVAGAGHVRTDRGVPAVLREDAPALRTVSVAFVEVEAGSAEPAAYRWPGSGARLPFDFVVFTPREEREDPCEGMRHAARRRGGARRAAD